MALTRPNLVQKVQEATEAPLSGQLSGGWKNRAVFQAAIEPLLSGPDTTAKNPYIKTTYHYLSALFSQEVTSGSWSRWIRWFKAALDAACSTSPSGASG
jgi:hypothetical protein